MSDKESMKQRLIWLATDHANRYTRQYLISIRIIVLL